MPKDRQKTTAKTVTCPYPVVNPQGQIGWSTDSNIQVDNGQLSESSSSSSMAPTSVSPPVGQRDNETNLIVNYLPSSMTQDDIRALFCSIGELESCKLVRDKISAQSLGYGFVKFKRPEDAKRAITSLNGLRLQNKTIKVSLARPSSDTIKGANLYISGLSKTMTSHDLHKLFNPFGDIITARVLCDPHTGFSKGVGFIRYNLKSQAELAIKELNGSIPSGSKEPITVKFANQPTVNKPVVILPQPLTTAICPQSGQIIGTFPAAPVASTLNRLRYPSPPEQPCAALPLTGAPPSAGWTLLVSNLPPDVDDNILWRLFGPLGAVHSVHVVRDPTTNKCKGFGFVSMSCYDDVILAVSALNGQQLNGHVISVCLWKNQTTATAHPSTLIAGAHPTAYGMIPGRPMIANIATPDALEVIQLGNVNASTLPGLQLVGYQGLPGAVAVATMADCGLTALPIIQ